MVLQSVASLSIDSSLGKGLRVSTVSVRITILICIQTCVVETSSSVSPVIIQFVDEIRPPGKIALQNADPDNWQSIFEGRALG